MILERARLAVHDPWGEWDALAPMSAERAQRVAAKAAARRQRLRIVVTDSRPDRSFDDRDLLTQLGADPNRGRGVIPCPAHEDRSPSLSWRLSDDGRALLHCFAGCTFQEIVKAAA